MYCPNPQLERGAMGSPLRSPPPEAAKNPTPSSLHERREEEATGSPLRSPLRRVENPIPLPAPPEKSPFDRRRDEEEAMDSHPQNPLPPASQNSMEKPAVAFENRLTRDDLAMVAKMVDGGGGEGGGADGGGAGGGEHGSDAPMDVETVFQVVPRAVQRAAVRRAALALRVSAVVLCVVSFSVMVADKTEGWAGDSFDRYEEYRYCLAVNIIAFVYSAFQASKEVYRSITRRYIIRPPMAYCFDFSMDQILAYLLISASSAAASRNDVWVSRFGGDDFTHLINASVAMSFLAFIALALSSLISAYNLFSWNF